MNHAKIFAVITSCLIGYQTHWLIGVTTFCGLTYVTLLVMWYLKQTAKIASCIQHANYHKRPATLTFDGEDL